MRAFTLLILSATPLHGQACPAGPLALVLAGGGAKGFAHIGVLRSMDSLGIRPDLIVGTSVGAIMGALYASGLSGRTIDSLVAALPLGEANRSAAIRAPHAWGSLLPLVLLEQRRQGLRLASGGAWEFETNALLSRVLLKGNLLARGDFDRLPIPFRAVATDLRTREAVVLARGDLAQAVRASIAIPLVFSPEEIDGRLLTDGGISANVPIAAARAAGARRLIVVDLKDVVADTGDLSSPAAVAGRLASFLFTQPRDSLGPDDAFIWPNVHGFANLDFEAGSRRRLIANGRAAADSVLPRMRCYPSRPPPAIPALPGRISGWRVSNGTARDSETMARILGLARNQRLDTTALDRQLAGLPYIEAFREIWLGPTGDADRVFFDANAVPAARREAGLGLAYDHDLGGRLWVGGIDRFSLPGLEASGVLKLGRFRSDVTGTLLSHLGVGRASLAPLASLRLALEDVRQFKPPSRDFGLLHTRTAEAFAGAEWARFGAWTIRAGARAFVWRNPDSDTRSTGGVSMLAGTESRSAVRTLAELAVFGDFHFVRAELGTTLAVGRVTLEPTAMAGVGHHLPAQVAFEFGGDEGFPGLQVGERRGDHQALAKLQASVPMIGPVAFRLLVAVGRIGQGGGLLDRGGWLGGLRGGFGGVSPIGSVAFEYGVDSEGDLAAFIRVGRWF
jgi:NTE family protein